MQQNEAETPIEACQSGSSAPTTASPKITSLRLQTILVVLGDGFNVVSTLITSMILARIISLPDMGTYRQILLIGGLLVIILEFAISASIYRFWNTLKDDEKNTFGLMIVFSLFALGSIAMVIMALVAAPLAKLYNNPDLSWALVIAAPFPLSVMFPKMIRPIWLSQGKSWQATSFDLLLSFTSIVALIIPLALGATFRQALLWWTFSNLLNIPCTLWAATHFLYWSNQIWSWNIGRRAWRYLWPIHVSRLPTVILAYSDKLIVSTLVSPAAFAIYSLGARELPFISTLYMSMSSVLVPRMVSEVQQDRFDEIFRLWRSTCEKTALLIYPIGAFAVIYSLPIVKFLFSAQYEESSIPLRIFALLIFIRIVDYANIATALGRSDLILKLTLISAMSLLALAVPLVSILGANGMALATVISTAIGSLLYLFEYRQLLRRPILQFFPIPDLLGTALVAFVAAIVGSLIQIGLGISLDADGFWDLTLIILRAGIVTFSLYIALLLLFKRQQTFSLLKIDRFVK